MGKALAYKRWKDKNPDKYKIYKTVFSAVRNGTLKRKKCFCGKIKVEAHHEDYSKPLEVIWLCKKHHAEYDRKRRKKLST